MKALPAPDRLVSVVLPRIKDFRGISPRAFDGRGNYTLALKDQLVFPEIDYNKVDNQKGMAVTIVTSAREDSQALTLLKHLGMPEDTSYGARTHIRNELEFSRDIFRKRPNWPVIDVTNKAIEETAADILRLYKQRVEGIL